MPDDGDFEERCNGICLTAREIMYPPSGGYDPDAVAIAHPDCPLHGGQSGRSVQQPEEVSPHA